MASLECFVWQLMKVLLVATREMAPAAEAHRLHDLAHAIESLVLSLLGVDQQLPHPIQADGALQFEGCAMEVFFGFLEQLLPVPATLECRIDKLYRGRWADPFRVLSGLMLRSMPWCFKRPERIRPPGCGSG